MASMARTGVGQPHLRRRRRGVKRHDLARPYNCRPAGVRLLRRLRVCSFFLSFSGSGFLMTRLTGFAKPVEDSKASLRDMRSVAGGALGEALVRAELGWPMLCNVILGASGRGVEIDQLARAPGGVIVLETKTSSGHVDWDLRSEC